MIPFEWMTGFEDVFDAQRSDNCNECLEPRVFRSWALEARSGVFVVLVIDATNELVLLVVEVLPRLGISSGQDHVRSVNVVVSADRSHGGHHQKHGANVSPIARVLLQQRPEAAHREVELGRGHDYLVRNDMHCRWFRSGQTSAQGKMQWSVTSCKKNHEQLKNSPNANMSFQLVVKKFCIKTNANSLIDCLVSRQRQRTESWERIFFFFWRGILVLWVSEWSPVPYIPNAYVIWAKFAVRVVFWLADP